uniref:HNH endonuclease signature motif containing protein n=1 Tax=Rhizobium sp. F40D2 TaxID=3453141 RepID=UPI003F2643DF
MKSGIVIRELLAKSPRCSICTGVVPRQAISIDHNERRQDGGAASVDNAQLTHPYCNTGFKEARISKTRKTRATTGTLF